ncbi:hypothetical protein AURDEDRAFT_177976 [Auricularia subglabra TFB-10046 SS5]|uniref:Uncharacterized protein n=1 Tax=Auricularia subglabra (strain TFB-10046 / SS5) TaxID=717982 RepID=J0L9B3_AURST|nr:hypothetical protein AURDEDRAFT_177976 [Auricularia subglabra TFB-10046 SS5]
MGPKSTLAASSPPKAAPSAASLGVSYESSRSSSSSPGPSPSSAGGVSGDAAADLVPSAAVAAAVPSGGIVPPALPVVVPAIDPAPSLAPAPATTVVPARVSESDGDDVAAVLEALATDDDGVVGEGPSTSGALSGSLLESAPKAPAAGGSPASVVEVAPSNPVVRAPPLGEMSWAELQADARARAADLLDIEHLGVPIWPAGEPSYVRIRRWERALAAAVDHFDNLMTSLKLPARLLRLVTSLRNRYGRQLALARDGCDSLRALVILEPEAARTPPPGSAVPGSSAAAGRRVCEVVVPPVPSAWAGPRPRSSRPVAPPAAGPSSPKKKRKADPSPSPGPSPPPPPRSRKGSKRAPVDDDGVPIEPCVRCADKNWSCAAVPNHDPCRRCSHDHVKCSWSELRRDARGLPARAGTRGRAATPSGRGRGGRARATREYSPPAPRRAPQAGSLLPDDAPEERISVPSGGLSELLRRAVRDGAADALAGVAQPGAPRSALRPPGQYRVRFGSTVGVAAPPEGPPTEPPSTPGSRRGEQEGEEEQEPEKAGGPAGDMDFD